MVFWLTDVVVHWQDASRFLFKIPLNLIAAVTHPFCPAVASVVGEGVGVAITSARSAVNSSTVGSDVASFNFTLRDFISDCKFFFADCLFR